MRISALFLFSLIFFLISCAPKDSGLGIRIPTDENISWSFDIYKINEDTVKIGTAKNLNLSTSTFREKDKVTEIERRIRLDSMQSTTRPLEIRSSYLQVKNGSVALYAENYFDVFDGLFSKIVLDTLSRNGDGDNYQQFNFIEPGWISFLNLDDNPEVPTEVHPPYKVYLDFYYRDVHLTGFVSVFAQTRFADFGFVDTQIENNILTYKYQTTTYFDFSLKKDSVELPPFRSTVDFNQWIHKTAGIIKRERTAFQLYIPQVPSRNPIVYIPGEFWILTKLEGISL